MKATRTIVRSHPWRKTGSSRFIWRFVPVCLLSAVCVISSWGTYIQFYIGLTLVTTPILLLSIFLLIDVLLSDGLTRLRGFDVLPLVMLSIVFLSRYWTLNPASWPSYTLWYMVSFAAYYSCRTFIYDAKSFRFVVLFAMLGSVIGSMMIGQITNEWGIVDDRMGVAGINQNFTSYVFAGSAFLSLIYYRYFTQSNIVRIVIVIFICYMTYSILRLGTRGALVSVALMLLWCTVTYLFNSKLSKLVFLSSLSLCLVFSLGALDGTLEFFEGFSSRNTGDLAGRMPTWQVARVLISDHLLTGVGAGAFQFLNPMGVGAHNIFLVLLLDTGLIGALSFLAFLLIGFAPAMRHDSHDADRFILGLFAAYFLPIATSGHVELSPFTWIVLALTFSLLNIRQESVPAGDRRFRHG